MPNEEEYTRGLNQLRGEAIADLEGLLAFAKDMLEDTRLRSRPNAKTFFRLNTFSALYQRLDAILALTHANQAAAASIIVRSMWETLAEYDFMNLVPGNLHMEIRLANESKQQKTNMQHIQRLRLEHPNAETWQAIISDEKIAGSIVRRQKELERFIRKHPSINPDSYSSLLARLEKIDNHNLSKNPNHKTLTQFDYRTVYSLLSDDTHSTLLGNAGNSRRLPDASQVRLESPIYETVRAAHIAYKLFLRFLRDFNRHHSLNKGVELKVFRDKDKEHDARYEELARIYGF